MWVPEFVVWVPNIRHSTSETKGLKKLLFPFACTILWRTESSSKYSNMYLLSQGKKIAWALQIAFLLEGNTGMFSV